MKCLYTTHLLPVACPPIHYIPATTYPRTKLLYTFFMVPTYSYPSTKMVPILYKIPTYYLNADCNVPKCSFGHMLSNRYS